LTESEKNVSRELNYGIARAPSWETPPPDFEPSGGRAVVLTDKDVKNDGDSVFSHFFYRLQSASRYPDTLSGVQLAQYMIHPIELHAAAFTPKGYFVTHVAPRNALRMGWRYVPEKKSSEALRPRLHKRLAELNRKFRIKDKSILAVQTSETYSRSLLYRRQVAPRGQKMIWRLFVTRIPDEWIEYDAETNTIIAYHPIVGWGLGLRQLTIKPEDAVLFKAEEDPNGNGFQAIPPLLPMYRSILRMENIEESWAELVTKRGLGLIDMTVEGAKDEAALEPYAKKYGDPSSYSLVVHNERVKVETKEGMRAAFDLDATITRFTKDISSASGYPSMRMEGVQTGTVTGSETDQDNMAENYSVLQERYEPYIIAVHNMLDPTLRGERYELEFELDIKLDKARQSELFNLEANTVETIQDILTINQALERLRLPGIPGEEGNLTVTQYIEMKANEDIPGVENQEEPEEETSPEEETEQESFSPLTKEQITEWITRAIKSTDCNVDAITRGLTILGAGLRPELKDVIGEILAKYGDSQIDELSYSKINSILSGVFGSGKSNTPLKQWRKR
jgi:hypothetical protein